MASIKDAFEESLTDKNAFWEFVIFAIPVFFAYDLFQKKEMNSFWILFGATFVILLGFMLECTANVRHGKDCILPPFNIFKIFWSGLKGVFALAPSIIINTYIAIFLCNLAENYIFEPNILTPTKYVIWGIMISIILTGYLCYARYFKIKDVYNLKIISTYCIDILIAVLFMIPQIILAVGIIAVPITYVIWLFFGIPNPIIIFLWSMMFVFTLGVTAHYLAQIDYEVISYKEDNKKIT